MREDFKYSQKINKLNNKFRGLVADIREKIVRRNLDIDILFKKIDANRNNRIDIQEFSRLFKLIDDGHLKK